MATKQKPKHQGTRRTPVLRCLTYGVTPDGVRIRHGSHRESRQKKPGGTAPGCSALLWRDASNSNAWSSSISRLAERFDDEGRKTDFRSLLQQIGTARAVAVFSLDRPHLLLVEPQRQRVLQSSGQRSNRGPLDSGSCLWLSGETFPNSRDTWRPMASFSRFVATIGRHKHTPFVRNSVRRGSGRVRDRPGEFYALRPGVGLVALFGNLRTAPPGAFARERNQQATQDLV